MRCAGFSPIELRIQIVALTTGLGAKPLLQQGKRTYKALRMAL